LISGLRNSNASAAGVLMASALPQRLGFLDCRLVIPGVTACNFAHARRSKIAGAAGVLVTASAGGRAAAGRELVDRCRSVIQTRIHCRLSLGRDSWRLDSCCARLVLDRVTETD